MLNIVWWTANLLVDKFQYNIKFDRYFFVKNIFPNFLKMETLWHMDSDSYYRSLNQTFIEKETSPKLANWHREGTSFTLIIEENINLSVQLKTKQQFI